MAKIYWSSDKKVLMVEIVDSVVAVAAVGRGRPPGHFAHSKHAVIC